MKTKISVLGSATWVFYLCCSTPVAQGGEVAEIEKAIIGKASHAERKHVAELVSFLRDLSQHPEHLTLATVVDTGSASFDQIHCITRINGVRVCSYADSRSEITGARLNQLRTFTSLVESDTGAEIRLEIDPAFACLPSAVLQSIWGVTPSVAPLIIPDFFAGSEQAPESLPVVTKLFRNINPQAPHTFAQARSRGECILALELSSIQPPNY